MDARELRPGQRFRFVINDRVSDVVHTAVLAHAKSGATVVWRSGVDGRLYSIDANDRVLVEVESDESPSDGVARIAAGERAELGPVSGAREAVGTSADAFLAGIGCALGGALAAGSLAW